MHRDISLNNLMYRFENGQLYGVLNDFDLSVNLKASPLSTSQQRTGTRPFMSMDLLVDGPPPPHVYRFDLESLLHAIVFLTAQYHKGQKIENPPLQDWYYIDIDALRAKKSAFVLNEPPDVTPDFRTLYPCLVSLNAMFSRGYSARAAHRGKTKYATEPIPTFEDDTLGNQVTFKIFSDILVETLPK
jgi:hypothetical protein